MLWPCFIWGIDTLDVHAVFATSDSCRKVMSIFGRQELPSSALLRACEDDLVSAGHHFIFCYSAQLTVASGQRVGSVLHPSTPTTERYEPAFQMKEDICTPLPFRFTISACGVSRNIPEARFAE